MAQVIKVFGVPGAGKTSLIINTIRDLIKTDRANINRVAYVVYNKPAAEDFKARIKKEFNLMPDEIAGMFCGTQHAVCYRLLGLTKSNVVKEEDKEDFCKLVKRPFQKQKDSKDVEDEFFVDDLSDDVPIGNNFFALYEACKVRGSGPTQDELYKVGTNFYIKDFIELRDKWSRYRLEKNIYSFSDFLEKVVEREVVLPKDIKWLFVDEAQDCGWLQFGVINMWIQKSAIDYAYVVGDEDQAIYLHLGASPKYMMEMQGEEKFLLENHRNAKCIGKYCNDLIVKNKMRRDKIPVFMNQEQGEIKQVNFEHLMSVINGITNNEKIYILARTNWQCSVIINNLTNSLIPCQNLKVKMRSVWTPKFVKYLNCIKKINTNKDLVLSREELRTFVEYLPAQYFKKEIKKKFFIKDHIMEMSYNYFEINYLKESTSTLTDFGKKIDVKRFTPIMATASKLKDRQRAIALKFLDSKITSLPEHNLFVGTMHASKGLQADYVFVVNDMPKQVRRNIINNQEAIETERRLFYVACSRAKFKLYIINGLQNGFQSYTELI